MNTTVCEALAATVEKVQVITWPATVQAELPWVKDPKATPEGSVSCTVTPWASEGPALVATTV